MPRIQRRARVRKPDLSELSKDHRRHLETGLPFFEGFADLDTFAAAWEIHRDEIMAEFIAKNPGHRPFAFWLLDHKKERPITQPSLVGPGGVPYLRGQKGKFGFLHTWIYGGPEWAEFQEPELAYLDRMHLLTAPCPTHRRNRPNASSNRPHFPHRYRPRPAKPATAATRRHKGKNGPGV
jgi:hypothetical protein